MIVVDSSVWIDHLRDVQNTAVRTLRTIDEPQDIIVGDLVLLEVLQGARNAHHAAIIEQNLRQFRIESMLGMELAVQAARNFRLIRERGVTIRKTVDLIIGTFCIMHGHVLLHTDRDFQPMIDHLGLRVT
ncbi:MAG: type II toxin-antitoxin system VapC family toxin [Pseudorhodoplanes sp.]